jgi:hypothetical protein
VGIIPSDFAIQERTNLFDVAWGKQSQRKMGSGKKTRRKAKHLCFQAGGHLK